MIQFFEQKLFSNFVLPSHRCSNFRKRANQINTFENNFEYFLNISIYEIIIDNIHLFFQSQLDSNLSCDIYTMVCRLYTVVCRLSQSGLS